MSEKRIFCTTIFFLVISIFTYIFSGLVALNLPKYYPTLNMWSRTALDGPGMGYYAKITLSIIIAVALSKVFYLVFPWLEKYFINSRNYLIGMAQGMMLVGIFFYIAEEWHTWGIEKRKLDNGELFNVEFWFYLILIGLFMVLFFIFQLIHGKYGENLLVNRTGDSNKNLSK